MQSIQHQRRLTCLLIGNYGVGNIGDEALREYFVSTFKEADWTVLGIDTPRLPFGFRSFFTGWFRTIGEMGRSDAVVFGGGSLFTDSESVFACVLWWWHGLVARVLRRPFILACQGVGPFRTLAGRVLARSTFRAATFISVRDEESLKRIATWKLRCDPVLTFDPAFSFFASKKGITEKRNVLAIIPRQNSDDQFFIEVSSAVAKPFDEIRVLLMQPDEREHAIAKRIATMTPKALIVPILSLDQLLSEVSGAMEVVSQRYHGALAALALGVPVTIVPQMPGDKLDELRLLLRDPRRLSELTVRLRRGEEAMKKALGAVS